MQKLKELFPFFFKKEYIDVTPISRTKPKRMVQSKKPLPKKAQPSLKTFSIKKFKPKIKPLVKKKKAVVRPVRPARPVFQKAPKAPKEVLIGEVTHFFSKIGVGIIKVKKDMGVGDKMHIKGATTDFTQMIDSMQIDHQDVTKASKGKEIGLKLKGPVRAGDKVFAV